MVGVTRCFKILEIANERTNCNLEISQVRPNWPEKGMVEFKDVSLKYRPHLETVLR